MSSLNIAYWNVHGLSDQKLSDDIFSNVCEKYDIICLAETMFKDSTRNLPGFSPPFVLNSKKTKKRGRSSGGLLIYIKPSIYKYFRKVSQSEKSIWLQTYIQNTTSQQNNDPYYFCFCYIKPYVTKTRSEDRK